MKQSEHGRRHARWVRPLVVTTVLALGLVGFTAAQARQSRPPMPAVAPIPAGAAPAPAPPALTSNTAVGNDLVPARLIIPRLHLDTGVRAVGEDGTGAMNTPRNGPANSPLWSQVFWWKYGAEPGQIGNMVIAGHVNRPDGSAAAFTHLNTLRPGDAVEIETVSGQLLHYTVTGTEAPLVSAPDARNSAIQSVFGPSAAAQLNMLTCWGSWDGAEYTRRFIVHSTLVGTPLLSASGTVLAGSSHIPAAWTPGQGGNG